MPDHSLLRPPYRSALTSFVVVAIFTAGMAGAASARNQNASEPASTHIEAVVTASGKANTGVAGRAARMEPPKPVQLRPLATAKDGRVDTIDGRRDSILFRRGTLHRIEGKGLSGGTAAWLIGPDGGGSVLTIRHESDTRLLVAVSDIAGARTPWPAGRTRTDARSLTVRIEAGYGERIFEFRLPRSVYSCRSGEPNCAR